MKIVFSVTLIIAIALFAATRSTAQNLFVASQGNIVEMTAGGMQSTFASGLGTPSQLAFNSKLLDLVFISSLFEVRDIIY